MERSRARWKGPARIAAPVFRADAGTGAAVGAWRRRLGDVAELGFNAALILPVGAPDVLAEAVDEPEGSAYRRLLRAAGSAAEAEGVALLVGVPGGGTQREIGRAPSGHPAASRSSAAAGSPATGAPAGSPTRWVPGPAGEEEAAAYRRQVFISRAMAFVDAMAAHGPIAGVAFGGEGLPPGPEVEELRTTCHRQGLRMVDFPEGQVAGGGDPDILGVRLSPQTPPEALRQRLARVLEAEGARETAAIVDVRTGRAPEGSWSLERLAEIRAGAPRHLFVDDYEAIRRDPPPSEPLLRGRVWSALLPLERFVAPALLTEMDPEEMARLVAYSWWQFKRGVVDGDRARMDGDYYYAVPFVAFVKAEAARAVAGSVKARRALERFFARRPELVRYLWRGETVGACRAA